MSEPVLIADFKTFLPNVLAIGRTALPMEDKNEPNPYPLCPRLPRKTIVFSQGVPPPVWIPLSRQALYLATSLLTGVIAFSVFSEQQLYYRGFVSDEADLFSHLVIQRQSDADDVIFVQTQKHWSLISGVKGSFR